MAGTKRDRIVRHVLNLREMKIKCSTNFGRVVLVWLCVESAIRIGIWLRFFWLRSVETLAAYIFLAVLGLLWLDFRTLQISLAAMDEMQEYVDKRIEENHSEDDSV
jgi:hypothetical protein